MRSCILIYALIGSVFAHELKIQNNKNSSLNQQIKFILDSFSYKRVSLNISVSNSFIFLREDNFSTEIWDLLVKLDSKSSPAENLSFLKTHLLKSGLYNAYKNEKYFRYKFGEHIRSFKLQISENKNIERLSDWDMKGWTITHINPSHVKGRVRVLLNRDDDLAISLTLLENSGEDPKILEYEIIVIRNEHPDFYTYNEKGKLDKCGIFYTGRSFIKSYSPHTCISCHIRSDGSFVRWPESRNPHNDVPIDLSTLKLIDKCKK